MQLSIVGRFAALILFLSVQACASRGWNVAESKLLAQSGLPASELIIAKEKEAQARETVVIAMGHAFALARHGENIKEDLQLAKWHLVEAYNSFEDLRDPNSLSVAFTADRKVPYRG